MNAEINFIIVEPYKPNAGFIAWLKKHRPRAAPYFERDLSCELVRHGPRFMVRIIGTNVANEPPEAVRDFDRQFQFPELCVVLDQHPDMEQEPVPCITAFGATKDLLRAKIE